MIQFAVQTVLTFMLSTSVLAHGILGEVVKNTSCICVCLTAKYTDTCAVYVDL